MAPERLVLGSKFDHRIDAWAIGVMLYKMLTDEYPYEHPNKRGLIRMIRTEPVDFRKEVWQGISIEAQDLVESLLNKDVMRRQTICGILTNSWVNQKSVEDKVNEIE